MIYGDMKHTRKADIPWVVEEGKLSVQQARVSGQCGLLRAHERPRALAALGPCRYLHRRIERSLVGLSTGDQKGRSRVG
jgi:cob(I)alamin adenosyltransferase